jgi:hypothetical protein
LKKLNYKKIAILGNSKKFIIKTKFFFNYELLNVIPWRNLEYFSLKKKNIYNLILICGYDFGSYCANYRSFKKINISYPIKFLSEISNNRTNFVYINTQNYKCSHYTFSRYKFAKQKLSYLLYRNFKNLVVINSDLILTKKIMSINSNNFSIFFFYILIKLGLLKTVDVKKIFIEIKKKLENKIYQKQKNIRGYFLFVPRTQFIDRILRLF